MDDDEDNDFEEELEEREPQVTSSDPNERKLARRLRIERRLEAIRKANAPEGEEEEEIVQKTLLQQQLQKSYELLEKLTIEGTEHVTNVRVANDSREVDRREEEGIGREKIIEQLEAEAASAVEQFEAITNKWTLILGNKDPLQIHEDVLAQKEKCDELIKQKDEIIAMLKDQIKTAEINFAKDQRKQTEDIETLAKRIEKQISMMRRAYRQELQLIEDVIMIERKILIDTNDKRWEELHKRRDQEEEMNSDKKFEQLEEFEEVCTKLRIDHQERYRETKIKLENDIEELQQQLEEIKTLALMNGEKLDYNYQILKKREDENIIIKSQQKRRINKYQDIINTLRKKINDYMTKTNNEMERLTLEVQKLQGSVLAVEAKADHFAHLNDLNYKQIWDLNSDAAKKVLDDILTTDRILYEQQLGLKWENPEHNVLEKTELQSYKSALQIMEDIYKKSEGKTGSKDKSAKKSVEKSGKPSERSKKEDDKLIPEGETMAHRRILRLILKQIADKSGFLIEERLKEVLKPYSEDEKALIKIDSVFAALQIKRKEEIEILLDYFLPYTYCPVCSGNIHPGSAGNSETEIVVHSFSGSVDLSVETSQEPLQHSTTNADQSYLAEASDIMSAIHQPVSVIDHIVSTIVDYGIPFLNQSTLKTGKEERAPDGEGTNEKSIEQSTSGPSKSITDSDTTKMSCKNRHPLVISSVYILRALKQFVSQFYEAKGGVITVASRLSRKRSTISRLIVERDIKMYWESFRNVFTPAKEELWDGLMFGLQRYHEILKDRKKLNDEVLELRRQNMELKYLLSCYKKDEKGKLKPPCALHREIPIKPKGL